MSILSRFALLSALLIAPATGCIFVSDDDPGDDDVPDETGTVEATWNLLDDGAAAGCPGPDATIVVQPAGGGTPYEDIYDCADGVGTAADIPVGNYTVWVDIHDGATLLAQSEAVDVSVDANDLIEAVFDIDVANGFFDISWTIAGSSCQASDGGVSVLSTIAQTTTAFDDVFDCEDGEDPAIATTAALPIADYVIAVSLLDSNDLAIGDAPEIQESITYGNEFFDLGVVTITLF
jgi:hypothetical protein